jgi:hypothetical protein
MLHLRCIGDHENMITDLLCSLIVRAYASWNWKCALLSASARSTVYLVATARSGLKGSLAVVLVEMAYVALTAGIYAGMQQRALGFRSRLWGDLTVVVAVPGLAQLLDWACHQATGASVTGKATLAVCGFTLLSALFHLHVMRRGAFLTGRQGRSLLNDFRSMPRLTFGFVVAPLAWISTLISLQGRNPGAAPQEPRRIAA